MPTFTKDSDARLDYSINWAKWLGDDTIVSSEWVDITDGITADDGSFTDTVAKVWLTGGTVNTEYKLTNRITTAAGRTDDRTISVIVRNR